MKILIIPDIHNHVDNVNFILKQEYDKAIFLGDYFDSYNDTPADALKTALWLANSLKNPKHIHLLGNHDAPYAFPKNHQFAHDYGYTDEKQKVINKVISRAEWDQFKLVHFEGSFMFSHAGLTGEIAPYAPSEALARKSIERVAGEALKDARSGLFHEFLSHKGLLWMRPWDFEPIPHITQVVGYTPTWMIKDKGEKDQVGKLITPDGGSYPKYFGNHVGGAVWFFDCLPEYYGILDGGGIWVGETGIKK